ILKNLQVTMKLYRATGDNPQANTLPHLEKAGSLHTSMAYAPLSGNVLVAGDITFKKDSDSSIVGYGFLQQSGFTYSHIQNASANLVRVDSALKNQYKDYQWPLWSYYSCSGISLEMVMNAYGRNYTAGQVLEEEQKKRVWDIPDGLTGGEAGM